MHYYAACRCFAGTYSGATGATSATTCVRCGAGERRVMCCPLTQSSLCAYWGGDCSTRIYVDSGKSRGLVRLFGVMRWAAGLLYAPRGDEEAGGGPRERHISAEGTPRRNRPLIRRRPAYIFWWCSSAGIYIDSRAVYAYCIPPPPRAPTLSPLLLLYMYIYFFVYMYIGTIYIDTCVFFSASLLRFYIYMYT
jgi:hypothetical protein